MADPHQFGIAGLIGWPVAHSRSPTIHNYWLDEHKIAGRYVLLPVPSRNCLWRCRDSRFSVSAAAT